MKYERANIKKVIRVCQVMMNSLVLSSLALVTSAYATDLGVYGSIYSISEPDMLNGIYQRLDDMQKDGELDQKNNEFKRRAINHILRPTPVKGITDLGRTKPTWHYYNPTIRVNHDITNTMGLVVAHKGQYVNPLKNIQLHEILYFVNGDNPKQMAWIKKQIRTADHIKQPIKIILVNGNIQTTAKAINHRVFFDQYGKLSNVFMIKHTPTVVYQPVNNGMILPRLIVKEVSYD